MVIFLCHIIFNRCITGPCSKPSVLFFTFQTEVPLILGSSGVSPEVLFIAVIFTSFSEPCFDGDISFKQALVNVSSEARRFDALHERVILFK